MGVKFEQSKTAENLARAFAGECQDGAKYQYSADMAQQQGLDYISTLLKQIATNEMAHAKVFMDLLVRHSSGVIQSMKFTADYPMQYGTLQEILEYDEQNERKQALEVYPEFARIAKEEGFEDVYDAFIRVAQVEACHVNQLHQLAQGLKNKTLYKSKEAKKFKCTNCGHEAELKEAWKTCPLCGQKQGMVLIKISDAPQDTVLEPCECWNALEKCECAKKAKDNRIKPTSNTKPKTNTKPNSKPKK